MFADARNVPADTRLEADLCIIGGGAAGITLACEFIGTPVRVVLLESGGFEYDAAIQDLYEGDLAGVPYFPLTASRLRFFGGTTNHWGGLCRPMDEVDFDGRDWIPLSSWPIRKAELDPFYRRAAETCNVKSWSTYESQQEALVSSTSLSPRFVPRVIQRVPLASRRFAKNYQEEIRQAPNVVAYLHANALDIQSNENGTTAEAVRVATLDGNRFSVAARIVVVAAGGIENARMLLVSNDQRSAGLGNQHDLVGRFFLEHPRFIAGIVIPSNPYLGNKLYEWYHADKAAIRAHFALPYDIQRKESLDEVQLRFEPVFQPSLARAIRSSEVESLRTLAKATLRGEVADDFANHVSNVAGDLTHWQQLTIPGGPLPVPHPEVVRELIDSSPSEIRALIPDLLGDIAAFAYKKGIGSIPVEQLNVTAIIQPAPNPDSRVTLVDDRDELGVPRVRLDWRLSSIDRHSVQRTMEILGSEVGRAGLGRLKIIAPADNEESWPDDMTGGWHHMGTTRMSDDPKRGVVDRNGRVHGMSNLFVAGSSVFPAAGSGTPTLALVALALRMADHLKGALG